MKYHIIITLFLSLSFSIATAQNKFADAINAAGSELAQAMVSKDYEILADYTYPKIIEMMGGRKRMITIVGSGMERMADQGLRFSKVEIGAPEEIFQAGSEIHCLVPQKTVMTNGSGTATNNSYLLAISNTNGERWYFLDIAQLTNENAKELFPEFNSNLKIPAKTPPIFDFD